MFASKDRIAALIGKPCKCGEGRCFLHLQAQQVKEFLDQFESCGKRDQDTVLFLAYQDCGITLGKGSQRKEYRIFGKPIKRICLEKLLGISSHRMDKVGQIDMRYGPHPTKPSELSASVDSFCCVLYNSVAEPLPDRLLGLNKIGCAKLSLEIIPQLVVNICNL